MPQRTQHSLIHVLLMWIAVVSVVQVAFVVLYFTGGHQNSVGGEARSNLRIQANNTPSLPSEHGLLLGKGKMLTFRATGASEDKMPAKWQAKNPDAKLISVGQVLTVKEDGYYFLNLQVTLCSCSKAHAVNLKWNDEPLLRGWTHTQSCSTGVLSKVTELSAGGTLEITVTPDTCINTTESETHLDIIFMHKP